MKKLYDALPIFLQNLAISLYGIKLRRNRHGSFYKIVFNEIDFSLSPLDPDLKRKIKEFLIAAERTVPAYKGVFSGLPKTSSGDGLDDVISILSYFPIIEKDKLREDARSYVSTDIQGKSIINYTSGSTGTPLEIVMSRSSLQFNYAFFHRFLSEIGVSEFDRSATFAGRVIVPKAQRASIYWRKNYAMNTLLLSSYHISGKNAKAYLMALESWDPTYIDSYPSAIYELASLFKDGGLKPKTNLTAIVTSSETLYKYQREVIEEVFGCPVFDYYGCAEQAVVAFQLKNDEDGCYIIPAQYCLVEVIDSDGSPVPPGKEGRLICTNLFNSNMPLIRYDIGDRAIVDEYYPGTPFAKTLTSITGRVDDVIKTKDGKRIGRLDPIFKGLNGIKEAQIVQHSVDLIEMRLVLSKEEYIDENAIARLLKERVGEGFKITFTYLEAIPRSDSGKFRSVVSNI